MNTRLGRDFVLPGVRLFVPLLLAFIVSGASSTLHAAYGVVTGATYHTVDTGAGLVFQVVRANGGINSIKLNGTELNSATDSGIASGLGSTGTTSSASADASTVVVTVATDATNGVVAGLTHYYIVRNGENTIYMATHATEEPGVGELRWITRLQAALFPNAPVESDVRGNTGAIESSDVFGMADSTTRSKYFGNQRAKDLAIRGVTGAGRGVFMVYGSRESSSGGPFFRDIQNQTGTNAEVYNYMNSGHNQTEPNRLGVLHGPYVLCFTDGSTPAAPDMSFLAGLGLTGYVGSAGRGSVVLDGISGRDAAYAYTVGFANTAAQYWANASASTGAATCANMKPGTYTMTVYKGELAVLTESVAVTAGSATALGTRTIIADPSRTVPRWRIGNWDGTPLEFRNGTNIPLMHPSDLRQASWTPGTFTVGGSALTDLPACQWESLNGEQLVNFQMTAGDIADHTIRIGITAAFAGGRPRISVNSWTSPITSASAQPDSRSLTIGTYRGNNATYTFSVPSSAFVVGTNTLTINTISGNSGTAFLSPGYAVDCVEIFRQPGSTLDVPGTPGNLAALAIASPRSIILSWNAAPNAAFEIRRATTANGVFAVVASNVTAPTWTDTDVAAPGVYYYQVVASNTSGVSPLAAVSLDPDAPPRSPATLTWTGAVSGTWDTVSPNWTYTGGTTLFYFPEDAVRFDNTSAVVNVALSGNLSPTSVTVDASQNFQFTGAGVLIGATTLAKSGAGTLTISAAHTFTGGSTVHAGTLALGHGSALGTGAVTLNGGTLATGTLAPLNSIVVTADSRITGGSTGGTHGIRAVSGSGTLTLEGSNTFDLEGSLAGFAGRVALAGTGSFRLFGSAGSSAAEFDLGTRNLNARSGSAFSLGSLTGAAGSSLGNNSSNSAATATFTIGGNGSDSTFGGVIYDGSATRFSAVTKTGSGALLLTGANTYTGATNVSAGALLVTGSLAATHVSVSADATIGGTGSLGGNLTLASGARLALGLGASATKGLTVSGTATLNGSITVVPAQLGGSLAPGTYPLLTHPGSLAGSPTFTWSDTIGSGYTATFDTAIPGQVKITLTAPLPTFSRWVAAAFPGETNPAIIGQNADPDHDGCANLLEYFLATAPGTPSAETLPTGAFDGLGNIVFTFRKSKSLSGVTFKVRQSPNLTAWTDVNIAPAVVSDHGTYEQMQTTIPFGGNTRLFLRLVVTSP